MIIQIFSLIGVKAMTKQETYVGMYFPKYPAKNDLMFSFDSVKMHTNIVNGFIFLVALNGEGFGTIKVPLTSHNEDKVEYLTGKITKADVLPCHTYMHQRQPGTTVEFLFEGYLETGSESVLSCHRTLTDFFVVRKFKLHFLVTLEGVPAKERRKGYLTDYMYYEGNKYYNESRFSIFYTGNRDDAVLHIASNSVHKGTPHVKTLYNGLSKLCSQAGHTTHEPVPAVSAGHYYNVDLCGALSNGKTTNIIGLENVTEAKIYEGIEKNQGFSSISGEYYLRILWSMKASQDNAPDIHDFWAPAKKKAVVIKKFLAQVAAKGNPKDLFEPSGKVCNVNKCVVNDHLAPKVPKTPLEDIIPGILINGDVKEINI